MTTTAADIRHRRVSMEFATRDGTLRPIMSRFQVLFNEWNTLYFGNKLQTPYVRISMPTTPRAYGTYRERSGEGGTSEIDLRPSLLEGTHPHLQIGPEFTAGRLLFIEDVLLHEVIHLWQREGDGEVENSYRGHGPTFRDKCNEIGEALRLTPVGTKHQRKLPNCAHWPQIVRPEEYYLGAFLPPSSKKTVPDNGDAFFVLTVDEWKELMALLVIT